MTRMSFQYYLLYLTNPTNSTFKKASGDIIIISDTFSFRRHALKSFHSLDRCFRFNEMRSSSLVAVLVRVITLIAIISKWTPAAINVDHIIFWIKAQRNIMIDFPIPRWAFPWQPAPLPLVSPLSPSSSLSRLAIGKRSNQAFVQWKEANSELNKLTKLGRCWIANSWIARITNTARRVSQNC